MPRRRRGGEILISPPFGRASRLNAKWLERKPPAAMPSRTELRSPVATVDELRALLDATEECRTRAMTARQEAARYADYYRFQIEGLSKQAAQAPSPEAGARLLRIAACYERLAQLAEAVKSPPISGSGLSDDCVPAARAGDATPGAGEQSMKSPDEIIAKPAGTCPKRKTASAGRKRSLQGCRATAATRLLSPRRRRYSKP